MAVALVGSTEKVQKHLNLSGEELLELLAGKRQLAWDELDLLTTLLVREQGIMIAKNRELAERLRLWATRS